MVFRNIKIFWSLLVASALLLAASPASAAIETLQTAHNEVGNQPFSGVGVKFTVNAPISVLSLGIFDSDQDGISTGTVLSAYLLRDNGDIVAFETFTATSSGTLDSFYRFKDITPFILGVGDYVLAGYGWTAADPEHNSNQSGVAETFTSSPLVTYISSPYGSGSDAPGTLPTTNFNPDDNFFSAANMKFSEPVPEPASLTLWGLGALGCAFAGYRRRKLA